SALPPSFGQLESRPAGAPCEPVGSHTSLRWPQRSPGSGSSDGRPAWLGRSACDPATRSTPTGSLRGAGRAPLRQTGPVPHGQTRRLLPLCGTEPDGFFYDFVLLPEQRVPPLQYGVRL